MKEKKKIIISSVLPDLLKRQGLTAKKLAQLSGVPPSTVATWLIRGSRPRNIEDVASAADVLEVSLQHLLFGEADQPMDLEAVPAETVLKGIYRLHLERLAVPESARRKKDK
jgi:transcriptional regulator with XRE-family HTH domain